MSFYLLSTVPEFVLVWLYVCAYVYAGNTDHENKTGQLMGAVLYSDGNFFMV